MCSLAASVGGSPLNIVEVRGTRANPNKEFRVESSTGKVWSTVRLSNSGRHARVCRPGQTTPRDVNVEDTNDIVLLVAVCEKTVLEARRQMEASTTGGLGTHLSPQALLQIKTLGASVS
jgi:hypothetical protein